MLTDVFLHRVNWIILLMTFFYMVMNNKQAVGLLYRLIIKL